MSRRTSLSIDGLRHQTAIPVATRIGPLLASSAIAPFDPGTRHVPDSTEAQIENIFRHAEKILEAAGGTWDDVVKMEFWAADPNARKVIDGPWIRRFPDESSRPARHTHQGTGPVITAALLAYISET